ncbi:MAG TPA: dihydrolipoyl dehydrogenase [Armatimonadetes bacterium]|nr:dihydrolipoyl dehydrogenase [Armatimonadota bacterium]
MSDKPRLLVLGAGPGGYPAAFLGADNGYDVTLVDLDEQPGGVCLHRGCIPSKALLHIAKSLTEVKDAARFGVTFGEPKVDLERLRAWKDSVVNKMTGGLSVLAKVRQVTQIQGRGKFIDDHHLLVELNDGGAKTVEFDYAVIATGSVPVTLGSLFPKSENVIDSTGALEVPDIPKTLLVVGGGYIGLELGSVYSALGSKVTVVEATSELLRGVDRDLVDILEKSLRERFHEILLSTKVTEAREVEGGVEVKLVGLDLKDPVRTFDKVLVAIGRKPTSANLGVEELGIQIDDHGFIKVDGQRRTAVPHIFAIGDVAGQPMLAHKATYEARIAVEAIQGKPTAYDPQAIPAVVFTDPEVAWAGLTEGEARTLNLPHKVTRFPWAASGRATTLARNDGLTKMILDPQTERILGMAIVGVGAGEMIAEGVLAIEMGAQASDIMMSIHAHPTLSETVMEAAELHFGHTPHLVQRGR